MTARGRRELLSAGVLAVTLQLPLQTGALPRRVDLVADPAAGVFKLTRCECDFGDNYWFALLSAVNDEGDAGDSPLVVCDDHLVTLHGAGGVILPADVTKLRELVAEEHRRIDVRLRLYQLCLPGQLSKSIYCARRAEDDARAAAHAAFAGDVLPLVASCLASSPWPLRAPQLAALLARPRRWRTRWPRSGRRLAHRTAWLPIVRRCVPLQRQGCWPVVASVVSESCEYCCDDDAPAECWSADSQAARAEQRSRCCGIRTSATAIAATPIADATESTAADSRGGDVKVEALWSPNGDADLMGLRATLHQGCSDPDSSSPHAEPDVNNNSDLLIEEEISELAAWLSEAAAGFGRAGQRVFPRNDLLLSHPACVDYAGALDEAGPMQGRGLEWFMPVASNDNGEDAGLLRGSRRSGLDLAADYGGICGAGVAIDGEEGAGSAEAEAVIPRCMADPAGIQRHAMKAYALELLPPRIDDLAFKKPLRKVAILLGELPHNIGHWARLAVWLYKLARGPLAQILQAFGNDAPEVLLVQTKYAAAGCDPNGFFCRAQSVDLARYPYASLLMQPAIEWLERRGITVRWEDLVGAAGSVSAEATEPRCYALAVQPWREWVGDARIYDAFRGAALATCGGPHPAARGEGERRSALPRRVVAAERGSRFRQWHPATRQELRKGLASWGRSVNMAVQWVRLGALSPCEQLRVVAESSLLIGIAGAETTHALFLPRGGALVEVDPFCAVGTAIRQASAGAKASTGDAATDNGRKFAATALSLRTARCCRQNFALGWERCAPRPDAPVVETAWRWRGPGLRFKGPLWRAATRRWQLLERSGACAGAGPTACDGGPELAWAGTGRWAELARARGLAYIGLHRCTCEVPKGGDHDCAHAFKHGHLRVDVNGDVLPALHALYDEYLRRYLE
eukprot:TRINITY_DN25893_c0_g1_i1.p1 TRINITY_DN25893_c0_g1~~TRINITY_DN25893_c0_g1_i1.p1  ORF type:complete len:914 (+),score=150.59 TRINITY_DN25893_c0_g1_i1:87-2828(+)